MIIFLYGEETFNSSSQLQKLKKDYLAQNLSSEPIVFDCDEGYNMQKIIESFSSQDLFAQKKLIIIKNFFAYTKADEQKKMLQSLEKKNDDSIVLWEDGTPRKNASLFVWLQKNADVMYEGKMLQGSVLEQWIEKKCIAQNGRISRAAVRELILYVGNDLWRLTQEIDKLVCYVGMGEIDVTDVQAIVHGRIDADIFQTIEAIVSGNKAMALTFLKKQIAKGDTAYQIFGMYAYQVRILLGVSSMVYENRITDKNIIAKTLKIHPFVAQKSLATVQRFSQGDIKKMHKTLTLLDYDIKQGKRDIWCSLDLFIANT